MSRVTYVSDAEYRKLLAAQKNNMHVNNKSDMVYMKLKLLHIKEDVKEVRGSSLLLTQSRALTYEEKEKALKEKEELKTRLESFDTSSKSLNTMHNSQLIAKDKAGFGHDGVKESKVSETITSVSKVETSKSKTSNDKMPKNETVRQAENPRKNNKSPRGNKRNWNNMMTQKLGDNFKLFLYSWYQSGLLLISRTKVFMVERMKEEETKTRTRLDLER
ncbi:hypothetical protein Tco_1211429 [Tanacetum coccineum]